MLTHGDLNDASSQATGTILFIYEDKTLLAAQDISQDIRELLLKEDHKRGYSNSTADIFKCYEKLGLVEATSYYAPRGLKTMLENKAIELIK